jgi:hypothetical protein
VQFELFQQAKVRIAQRMTAHLQVTESCADRPVLMICRVEDLSDLTKLI